MAFNPNQADKTREQIEAVPEKLLPQKETEERFAIALLDHLRPLVHRAA
jgi:transcriptional antiterminator